MKTLTNLLLESTLLDRLMLFLIGVFYRYFLRVRRRFSSFVLFTAYVTANKLFPDATLEENRKVARFATDDLFLDSSNTAIEYKEKIKHLQENILSDEEVVHAIVNYFLIDSFYWSYGNEDGHNEILKEKSNKAMDKAKFYRDTAEPVSAKDIGKIDSKIKKDIRVLKKLIQKTNSSKIEDEKSKIINSIEITTSAVFISIPVFSGLFLIGGFLYNKLLLGFLGVDTSDFFEIADYLSSSIDVVFPVFIAVLWGMFFYFKGALRDLSGIIAEEQIGIKYKSTNVKFVIVVILSGAAFLSYYYVYGVYVWIFLFLPILFCLDYIVFDFLEIYKYVKNRFTFHAVVFSFFIFIIFLGIKIAETLTEIKNGDYHSPYVVFFEKEYEEYSEHEFLLSNSNYIFLLNTETRKIVVIPKTGIKSIHAKKEI